MNTILRWLRRLWDLILNAVYRYLYSISGAPTIQHVAVEMEDVRVERGRFGLCHLQLGGVANPNVQGFRLTVPLGRPTRRGQIEFVQLVQPLLTRTPGEDAPNEKRTSDGEWVLDTRDPYGGLTFRFAPPPPNNPVEAAMYDSPGAACVRYIPAPGGAVPAVALERVTADCKFRTFVLWRPENFSWRVTISCIEWNWNGAALQVTDNEDCSCLSNAAINEIGKWVLQTPPGNKAHTVHRNVPPVPPRWRRVSTDLQWVPA